MWNQTQKFVYVVYDNFSILCMKICLFCVWQFFYVVYDIFWLLFFVYIVYDIKSDLNIFYISYNTFRILQLKNKIYLLTGVYGCVVHHILHEEEKYRMKNTDLGYDPKEDKFLIYCSLYVKYLEEYTKKVSAWTQHWICHRI